jgi:hypothetical protein
MEVKAGAMTTGYVAIPGALAGCGGTGPPRLAGG